MFGDSYWPWWTGALALAIVALGFWRATGRVLGVSGIFTNFLEWRRTREIDRAARAMRAAAPDRVERALLEATRRMFPDAALPPDPVGTPPHATGSTPAAGAPDAAAGAPGPAANAPKAASSARPLALASTFSLSANAVFIAAVVIGAAVAGVFKGSWRPSLTLGPEFEALVGGGAASLLVLFGGGLLVGAGTSMAGGCTSGHGLCGSSRLERGSLLTTATFLGTAMALSWLLGV